MEEINKKNNYTNHLAECFNKKQKLINDLIDKINDEKGLTGFQEVRDMTPRFFNSSVKAIKYFQKNNINYYDDLTENPEKLAMEAWECYAKKQHSKSIDELIYLKDDIYKVKQEINDSKEYKSRIKQRNLYTKLVLFSPTLMGLFNPIAAKIPALNAISYHDKFAKCKNHLNNYLEIADKIYELNPDTDLINAFIYYLDEAYNYIKSQKYNENVVKNNAEQNYQINFMFKCLVCVLYKLNKKEDINTLTIHYLKLIEKESVNRLDNFKKQYEEFKKNTNIGGTDNIVQDPHNKSLARRKKSNN